MRIGEITDNEKSENPVKETAEEERPVGETEYRIKGISLMHDALLILGCVSSPEVDDWKAKARWWLEQ